MVLQCPGDICHVDDATAVMLGMWVVLTVAVLFCALLLMAGTAAICSADGDNDGHFKPLSLFKWRRMHT